MKHEVKRKPVCYIIAGPNGAGKTTYALEYLTKVVACMEFVNSDLIAQGLSPFNVDSVQLEAGRLMLKRLRELARNKADFAFETTFSGRSLAIFIEELRSAGYWIELYYLWIPSVHFSKNRVKHRVKAGGHDIPDEAIKRRFGKSLKNLINLYLPLVDVAFIVDNSGVAALVAEKKSSGKIDVVKSDVWSSIVEESKCE